MSFVPFGTGALKLLRDLRRRERHGVSLNQSVLHDFCELLEKLAEAEGESIPVDESESNAESISDKGYDDRVDNDQCIDDWDGNYDDPMTRWSCLVWCKDRARIFEVDYYDLECACGAD